MVPNQMEGTKMRPLSIFLVATLACVLGLVPDARASLLFVTMLANGQPGMNGDQEVPPNPGLPATGFGTVLLDDAMNMITVDESWSNLSGPATASHIHLPAPPGMNAPVVFPFTGVPSAATGSIPEQTFAIDATELAVLMSGQAYMNVHTALFPGGEIRGQLEPVPEPSALLLLGAGAVGLIRCSAPGR
jgi:CHRD domain/PEP-CTERM motif